MNPLYPSMPAAYRGCPAPRLPGRAVSPVFHRSVPRGLRRTLGALLLTAGLGVTAAPANALDVNQASAQELEGIRGIGPRTAEIIVSERERGGKFDSFEDLAERVRGIGLKKAQALESAGLQVGAGGAASAAPSARAAAKPVAMPAGKSAAAPGAKPAAKPASGQAALKAQAPPRP